MRCFSICTLLSFLYLRNISIDYMCQLPQRPLARSLAVSLSLVFFFLIEFSSNRAPPYLFNLLCRKNEEDIHSIAPRLLFFFACKRERSFSLLHSSGTSVLFPSFASPSSLLSLSSPFHIFTQLHIHQTNDQ